MYNLLIKKLKNEHNLQRCICYKSGAKTSGESRGRECAAATETPGASRGER